MKGKIEISFRNGEKLIMGAKDLGYEIRREFAANLNNPNCYFFTFDEKIIVNKAEVITILFESEGEEKNGK